MLRRISSLSTPRGLTAVIIGILIALSVSGCEVKEADPLNPSANLFDIGTANENTSGLVAVSNGGSATGTPTEGSQGLLAVTTTNGGGASGCGASAYVAVSVKCDANGGSAVSAVGNANQCNSGYFDGVVVSGTGSATGCSATLAVSGTGAATGNYAAISGTGAANAPAGVSVGGGGRIKIQAAGTYTESGVGAPWILDDLLPDYSFRSPTTVAYYETNGTFWARSYYGGAAWKSGVEHPSDVSPNRYWLGFYDNQTYNGYIGLHQWCIVQNGMSSDPSTVPAGSSIYIDDQYHHGSSRHTIAKFFGTHWDDGITNAGDSYKQMFDAFGDKSENNGKTPMGGWDPVLNLQITAIPSDNGTSLISGTANGWDLEWSDAGN